MLPARPLQVLGACAALALSAPLASNAQAPQSTSESAPLSYEQLRASLRATRLASPEQASDLRDRLAGAAVEISGRVAGVMSNREGRSVLLQYATPDGAKRTYALQIAPQVLGDAASMRALRADATVRILATVSAEGTGPLLVMVAATDKAAPAPLFREDDGGDVLLMAPVNGALPIPELSPEAAASMGAPNSASEPEPGAAVADLPQARVPIVKRVPLVSAPAAQAAKPAPRSALKGAPMPSGRAPRAHLAPPPSIPSADRPKVAKAVPPLVPVEPSVYAAAQRRAPSKPASRGGNAASRSAAPQVQPQAADPVLFADDERIESQVPAYQALVKRFNKKLSAAQVEEIARALLTAGYRQNMDPRFLAAIIAVESDFDIYCLSSSGAMGLGQIMPFNLPEVGMQKADAWNPTKNVIGTAMLLRGHLDDFKGRPNSTLLAVAAYNAGPNAVKRAGYKVPNGKQVQRYVWKVYYRYKEFAPELFR